MVHDHEAGQITGCRSKEYTEIVKPSCANQPCPQNGHGIAGYGWNTIFKEACEENDNVDDAGIQTIEIGMEGLEIRHAIRRSGFVRAVFPVLP